MRSSCAMQAHQAPRPVGPGTTGPVYGRWRAANPRPNLASCASRRHVSEGQPAPGEEQPTSSAAHMEAEQQRAIPPPHAAAAGTAGGAEGHPKPLRANLLHRIWDQLSALWPGLAGAVRGRSERGGVPAPSEPHAGSPAGSRYGPATPNDPSRRPTRGHPPGRRGTGLRAAALGRGRAAGAPALACCHLRGRAGALFGGCDG
jgi:hypothetical protein